MCTFIGELAQMVERLLSMREVAGSMPAFSMRPLIGVPSAVMTDQSA